MFNDHRRTTAAPHGSSFSNIKWAPFSLNRELAENREASNSLVSAYGVGSGRPVNKALVGPYKSYSPHTFGLKSAYCSFGLANLIVVNY